MNGRSGWTRRYYCDRERVLGRCYHLSQDPDLAAEQLAAALGSRERARRWAGELLGALNRRRAA
jgi:hypothetical protein